MCPTISHLPSSRETFQTLETLYHKKSKSTVIINRTFSKGKLTGAIVGTILSRYEFARNSMDKQFLKGFIEKLSRSAFESFVQQFFREAYPQEPFEPCSDIGEGVFRRELLDSYGGSIHAIYITHSLPIELFNQPKETIFAEPGLVGKLRRLRKKYKRELGQWGMVSPCLVP